MLKENVAGAEWCDNPYRDLIPWKLELTTSVNIRTETDWEVLGEDIGLLMRCEQGPINVI